VSSINLFRCDSCGRTAPSDAGAEQSPPGWVWIQTMCGEGFDACSTTCGIAILKTHDHTNERREATTKQPKQPKTEKPS